MRQITRLVLLAVFALSGGIVGMAQGAQAAQGGTVPKMKIAIVDIIAFREQIAELKVKYDKLQTEFTTTYRELESMQGTLAAQEKTLNENASLTPQQAAKLQGDFEAGKKEYQRRLEDTQETARRREKDETEAIYDKLSKFLDQYCTKNGITSVYDARRLQETGVVVYVSGQANITDDFIKEYNKANPLPAAKP